MQELDRMYGQVDGEVDDERERAEMSPEEEEYIRRRMEARK